MTTCPTACSACPAARTRREFLSTAGSLAAGAVGLVTAPGAVFASPPQRKPVIRILSTAT